MILNYLFLNDPILVEDFYFNNIFTPLRNFGSYFLKFLPFSAFYLWLISLIYVIFLIKKYTQNLPYKNWLFSLQLIGVVFAHLSFFYLVWGYNYQRVPISERLNFNSAITQEEFSEELESTLAQLNFYRSQMTAHKSTNWSQLNNDLSVAVSEFLKLNGLSYFNPVYSKPLYPKGSLLVWSTAGIYWPFAGESMIDAGLHNIEIPFTMAHELGHGMGWTDEGECNWIAYESCIRSADINIKYSAYLSYWKYLLYQTNDSDSSMIDDLYSRLDTLVIKDLISIREQHNQYPDFFPKLRNAFYNWYLKKNRVVSGIKSYNEIVRLAIH